VFLGASVTIGVDAMALEIVGREEELASVRAFVERAEDRLAALLLEGNAGIGKSTLWLAGVEHAGSRGAGVLSCRLAEAERGLAHVGLGDLFEDVLDDVLPSLARPRRRALEVALADSLRKAGFSSGEATELHRQLSNILLALVTPELHGKRNRAAFERGLDLIRDGLTARLSRR
jgi:AAA ATPase-like protein